MVVKFEIEIKLFFFERSDRSIARWIEHVPCGKFLVLHVFIIEKIDDTICLTTLRLFKLAVSNSTLCYA